MESFLPVLAARGLKGDLVPDRQPVDLTGPGFPDGRPPGFTAPPPRSGSHGGE